MSHFFSFLVSHTLIVLLSISSHELHLKWLNIFLCFCGFKNQYGERTEKGIDYSFLVELSGRTSDVINSF